MHSELKIKAINQNKEMHFSRYIKSTIILSSKLILVSLLSAFSISAFALPQKETFTVVIDAGHGGKDFGAIDNNLKEKDINLSVAKKLASKIKKGCKDVNVVLTRDNDSFLSLQDRAKVANDNKGNLFISIHTNSVDKSNPRRTTVAGASVYALGLHKDKNNLEVAMRENSVIELEKNFEQKYSGFDPSKDESYIIFEMAQKKNLGQSLKFADMAQKNLVSMAGRGDRGVKQAGFWVLWATSMPAVLVELDFICNPNSAVYMGSEKGQEQMAEALFKAFEKYYSSYSGNKNTALEEEAVQPKAQDSTAVPIVASAQPIEKQSVESENAKKTSVATKRRRRSDAAKKISISRNVETASIPLHSEEERLPNIETPKETTVVAVAATAQTPSKNKKDKKKKNTSEAKSKNPVTATYNNKTVIVNKAGSSSIAGNNDTSTALKKHKSISGYHSKVEKLKTVYKIQILASAELLKQNNPEFHGLEPIKSFKENNLYKYTYGESESKQEMESLLKQVKQIIPDAFIIKSMK